MKYEVIARNEKHVRAISAALKKADALYLATDPDREGEAIAWHVAQAIKTKNGAPMRRVLFHELTRDAVVSWLCGHSFALFRSRTLDWRRRLGIKFDAMTIAAGVNSNPNVPSGPDRESIR